VRLGLDGRGHPEASPSASMRRCRPRGQRPRWTTWRSARCQSLPVMTRRHAGARHRQSIRNVGSSDITPSSLVTSAPRSRSRRATNSCPAPRALSTDHSRGCRSERSCRAARPGGVVVDGDGVDVAAGPGGLVEESVELVRRDHPSAETDERRPPAIGTSTNSPSPAIGELRTRTTGCTHTSGATSATSPVNCDRRLTSPGARRMTDAHVISRPSRVPASRQSRMILKNASEPPP
jgi:hypothetical protein